MTDTEIREGLCVGELVVVSKAGLEALYCQLAEFRKDQSRLNWLQLHASPIKYVPASTGTEGEAIDASWCRYGSAKYQNHYATLREAIDAELEMGR